MNNENKNGFFITWVSCIVVLLTLCFFGINDSIKGTHSFMVEQGQSCGEGYTRGDCITGANGKIMCSCIKNPSSSKPTNPENPGDSEEEPAEWTEETCKLAGWYWVNGNCLVGGYPDGEEPGYEEQPEFTKDKESCENAGHIWTSDNYCLIVDDEYDPNGNKACWACDGERILSSTKPSTSCEPAIAEYCTGESPSPYSKESGNTCGQKNYGFWTFAQCEADRTNVWSGDAEGNYCCDVNKATLDPNQAVIGYVCGQDPTKQVYKDSNECTSHGYVWDCNSNCCDVNRVVNCEEEPCFEPKPGPGTGPSGDPTDPPSSGTPSGSSEPSSSNTSTSGCYKNKDTGVAKWFESDPDSNSGTDLYEKVANSECEHNITDNPATGQIAMFIVWIIGFASIGYSIYYLMKFSKSE